MNTLHELIDSHSSYWGKAVEAIAYGLVLLTPLFFLSVNHWITNASIIGCIFILMAYALDRMGGIPWDSPVVWCVVTVTTIYTIAIVASQIGRGIFVYQEFLDQTRWLLGFPFFMYVYTRKIDYTRALNWIAPLALLLSWISSTYVIPSDAWGERYTISFMDPLAYGFNCLSLALTCLAMAAWDISRKQVKLLTYVKIAGFMLGAYLSMRTGSRSGWLALPLVIFILYFFLYSPSIFRLGACCLVLTIAFYAAYVFSPAIVKLRIDAFINEFWNYPWGGGVAADTSIGMRITFYRLAFYYFSQSPIWGWGERGYTAIKDAPELLAFSSQYTRDFAYGALFHSEWSTQTVRFGIFGLLGVFWVLLFPITFFGKLARREWSVKTSCIGLVYMVCQFAASIGDEVFNSKAMVTFASIFICCLIGSLCHGLKSNVQKANLGK